MRGMLAGAKRDPGGWATELYDETYSAQTVGDRCAADVVRLPAAARPRVMAAFRAALSAAEFAHLSDRLTARAA